jgi:hypothetical protein
MALQGDQLQRLAEYVQEHGHGAAVLGDAVVWYVGTARHACRTWAQAFRALGY